MWLDGVGWCGWMGLCVVGIWLDLVDVTCVWMKIRSGWMRIWCGCRNV